MTRSRMMLGVLLAGLVALPAHASAPRESATPTPAQVADALARMHDPDALVTAALMDLVNTGGRRETALLAQAQRLDPGAADITALSMLSCHASAACDTVTLGNRLQAMDPGNALAWMPRLQRAIAHGAAGDVTRILRRMAQSSHFDTYWVRTLGRLDRGTSLAPSPGAGPTATSQRIAYVFGLAQSVMPNFQHLVTACRPGDPAFPSRRASCRAIGVMMQAGPMLVTDMIGTVLHRRSARDRSDYAHALEATRDLVWVQDQFAKVTRTDPSLPGIMAYLHDIQSSGSEAGAMRRVLQRAHLPLEPPKDWTSRQLQHMLSSDPSPYAAVGHAGR